MSQTQIPISLSLLATIYLNDQKVYNCERCDKKQDAGKTNQNES